MDYRVDEKGKFYTQRVNKRMVAVTARLADTIVHGTVYLTLDNRLKDELNTGDTFIAITKAEIMDAHSDRTLFETEVLIVNKTQLVWIFPREPGPQPVQTTG